MSIEVNYSNGKLHLVMTNGQRTYDICSTDNVHELGEMLTLLSKYPLVNRLKKMAEDPIYHSGIYKKKWLDHVEFEISKYFEDGGNLEDLPSFISDNLSILITIGGGDESAFHSLSYKKSKKYVGNNKNPGSLKEFRKWLAMENFRMFHMGDSDYKKLIQYISKIKKDVNYEYLGRWQQPKHYFQYYAEKIVKESSFLNKNKSIKPVDDDILSLSGFYKKVSINELFNDAYLEVFNEEYGTSELETNRLLSTIFGTVKKHFDNFECCCYFPFPSSFDDTNYDGHIHTELLKISNETRYYLFSGINKKTGRCEALCYWVFVRWD